MKKIAFEQVIKDKGLIWVVNDDKGDLAPYYYFGKNGLKTTFEYKCHSHDFDRFIDIPKDAYSADMYCLEAETDFSNSLTAYANIGDALDYLVGEESPLRENGMLQSKKYDEVKTLGLLLCGLVLTGGIH